jgi:hypothetical protein
MANGSIAEGGVSASIVSPFRKRSLPSLKRVMIF